MSRYLKKEGLALRYLAMYLMSLRPGDRLKPISALRLDSGLSVGLLQGALMSLEQGGCVQIQRQGRNGSLLSQVDYPALLRYADIPALVCAMPLPYTKKYEGLATGLRQAFSGVPFWFAHMSGADVRVECLCNGLYDMAVMSRLAAEYYCAAPDCRVEIAILSGPDTCARHGVIRRQGDKGPVKRVALDSRSLDQRILTREQFPREAVDYIEISYHHCLHSLAQGMVDAVVWNTEDPDSIALRGLSATPLAPSDFVRSAAEAAVVIRKGDATTRQLLSTFVDVSQVVACQQQVIRGECDPRY
ncbi:GntR family transcriptional regulator YhfZ [Shimwellia blattae]|uniref:Amino acid transporter n=1 Tax=Shimwellia blattae (strain ATCC 29907 / DSM 4481 / JCM 1650 / NBRC 105725 / CDC 9005-74) TaxID=630626 RepID=I2B9Y6_SHIBC|nr:GntR family transcriptional regulator YhfZ [Shimwellia blattae]AFJ47340.1 amino acid transporter [Shimwellia blattae DSM 4481 = NBRC 105725]GAB80465.1 hypothetical protein YhfZ [Shimwellia blattae DSM 4481 = NBRC 105725]VDY64837.1 Uncharacterised protein [Shimwellia blattae]VEC22952.1 Uncharacterised protein [Shimwellia blattae]